MYPQFFVDAPDFRIYPWILLEDIGAAPLLGSATLPGQSFGRRPNDGPGSAAIASGLGETGKVIKSTKRQTSMPRGKSRRRVLCRRLRRQRKSALEGKRGPEQLRASLYKFFTGTPAAFSARRRRDTSPSNTAPAIPAQNAPSTLATESSTKKHSSAFR